jgi:hypothetical protein
MFISILFSWRLKEQITKNYWNVDSNYFDAMKIITRHKLFYIMIEYLNIFLNKIFIFMDFTLKFLYIEF